MILTKIHINNWYSFVDSELDLTYARKSNESTIQYEYLSGFENIRFKRVIVLTGANASGKTSFAKIILSIRNFINDKKISKFFEEGMRKNGDNLEFTVEFIDKAPTKIEDQSSVNVTSYDHLHYLKVQIFKLNENINEYKYKFTYKTIEIKKTDSIEKLREILKNYDGSQKIKLRNSLYLSNFEDYTSDESKRSIFDFENLSFNVGWNFLYNDLSDASKLKLPVKVDREILESILKTFDPSITSVKEATEKGETETNGFFINFHNNDKIYLSNDGKIDESKRYLLSLGTYEAIKIASFISVVVDSEGRNGCTFFLDEGMSHVQSEIERAIVVLIIEKMNKYSQFFYTTHNYDILDMNLPIHSYLFIKKDESFNSQFIKAEDYFSKNDRSIINYIKNDVLCTLPDTTLIDEILMRD
ncbi:ATP-binding protein [Acinetobacter bereziniae]|uniref:ATP-binding protein n=1 Tax=Acinetobacter bereziniae TaxID=106648 RepID=A0A8I1AHM3_ACIBZ|nr:AAA family ATPase [Acinetobacter bereziniae]QQC82785.1 ATP-binding protein [Acinetobacter bereziniae]UUN95927.1 ATP-binding protein [Acinetobacter bereziniae]